MDADLGLNLAEISRLLAAWNARVGIHRQATRAVEISAFGAHAFGDPDTTRAAARLLAAGPRRAAALASAWDACAKESGLSPKTRAGRLYTLRSLVDFAASVAESHGRRAWRLDVLPARTRRRALPSSDAVLSALEELELRAHEHGRARDWRALALVLVIHDTGLELTTTLELAAGDVSLDAMTVAAIRRNGSTDRRKFTERCRCALLRVIGASAEPSDPIFGMTRQNAHRIFRALGLGSPDCVRRAGLARSAA